MKWDSVGDSEQPGFVLKRVTSVRTTCQSQLGFLGHL